jgi:hypothetical protein
MGDASKCAGRRGVDRRVQEIQEFRYDESVGATGHTWLATRSRRCGAVGQTLLRWQTLTLCSG